MLKSVFYYLKTQLSKTFLVFLIFLFLSFVILLLRALSPQVLEAAVFSTGSRSDSNANARMDASQINSGMISSDHIDSVIARDVEVNELVTNISGNTIQSGVVKESFIDSSVARDQEVLDMIKAQPAPAIDTSALLRADGTTPMSGDLNMGGAAINNVKLVNGQDVALLADHEVRLKKLETPPEEKKEAPTNAPLAPIAFGVFHPSGDEEGCSGFNIKADKDLTKCAFELPAASSKYIVMLNGPACGPGYSKDCHTVKRTREAFSVQCKCTWGANTELVDAEFLVYEHH